MTLAELRERAERAIVPRQNCPQIIAALCRALEAADDMASYRGEWGRDDYAEKRAALDALLGDTDAD